jgi:S-(hydroxymethyl)glutathione dehydrogenase/alcohol dehydrogenase
VLVEAAVCRAFGDPLAVEEVELRAPGLGEVGVRVAACAICHSDIAYMRGAWGGPLPAVYGHEAAGIVEEVGAGVDDVQPGDHVVVTLIRYCGRCRQCLRGLPSFCERWPQLPISQHPPLTTPAGEPVFQALKTAAFAERVTVHASQVVPIPEDVPLESASLLACGVLTGVGAVLNTARVEAGGTVGVVGVGGVGLNCVQGAVLAGASLVAAVDLVEHKLDAARTFGATHAFRAGEEDVTGGVEELTGGRGLDYVFVAAGAGGAVEQALAMIGTGGTVVLVGLPTGVRVPIEPESLADRGQRVLGSKMGSARPQLDVPALVELYRQGRLKLDELVSGRYALADVNEAIASADRGEALRPVLVLR